MKRIVWLLLLLPAAAVAQKVKSNEYDKFVRQRRIELEALPIYAADKQKVSLSLSSLSSTLYLSINGLGWGASAIGADQEAIFLFSNDSTLTVKSIGLQSYDFSPAGNSYKHQYFIQRKELEMLSKYELIGIRKYSVKDFNDLKVSKENAARVKKLSNLFIEELKKAHIIQTLIPIDIREVEKHVGDSVYFCSRVYNARYFEESDNKPTLLDLNSSFSNKRLNTVIWEQYRPNFANAPEICYNNKEVCISGVVEMVDNLPQITLRDRDQIRVKSPIELKEAALFVGDSVTIRGRVMTAKYFSTSENAPTLLNLGAAYPDQLLTVVIDKKNRDQFGAEPETEYVEKDILVTGKLTLYNGKPQIAVSNKKQLQLMNGADGRPVQKATNDPMLQASSKTTVPEKETAKKVSIRERTATFPGGDEAWTLFLKENLKPPVELSAGEKKTVIATFLINKEGLPSNIEIQTSGGKIFDREVLRVLGLMPNWTPQIANGKATGTSISQPITFVGVEPELTPKR